MIQYTEPRRIRIFTLIWLGQLVSLFGSGLTGFALGVWVYQRTGSATQFALISLFTRLPGLVISPLAGAIVDNWNRRWAMLLSDSGAGLSTLVIAVLLFAQKLEIWHIYLAVAISSTFSAFQEPAYASAITLLVPKQHLSRANSMMQMAESIARLFAPVLAGFLVVTIQIYGVFLLDFATFVFALVTLLSVRFPKANTTTFTKAGKGLLLGEIAYGWTYITARPGLLGLLIFLAASNFLVGMVEVLVTPMVLSFASTAVLGSVLSFGGSGMLMGSFVWLWWGGPKRRIYGVLGGQLLSGLCILLAGLQPSAPLIAVAAFVFFFSQSLIKVSSQTIWQRKVLLDVQGRVFAVKRTLTWSSLPFAYLVAGPLADRVFEPLMATDGLLAGSLGQIIGVGSGRGIGLLFITLGTFAILATVAAYKYPRLRFLEDELPERVEHETFVY
ncbi:MFS transporter [Microcoleus sp. K1-B6]|uniref:MFS transporter n=1 Tax=unclassified Microcoleus TaxID=2642155 RepID=UPI002FD2F170